MKGVKAVGSSLAAENLRPASGRSTRAVHAVLLRRLLEPSVLDEIKKGGFLEKVNNQKSS
jgi:hypothetical protein